jgi:hypothetical protein
MGGNGAADRGNLNKHMIGDAWFLWIMIDTERHMLARQSCAFAV